MKKSAPFISLALSLFSIIFWFSGTYQIAVASTCVPPPPACSLNGPISISEGGKTLRGTISGDSITIVFPDLGTLQGKVDASMGSFSVYDPMSGQTLHGNIEGSSLCSPSDDIQRQADLLTYNACISTNTSKTSLSDLLPQATVNQLNCMKMGTWFEYDEKSQTCVDSKSSELTLACQYYSNYGPNSYYDVTQDKCLCQGGYTMQYNSSIDKLRCVVPQIAPVKPEPLKGELEITIQTKNNSIISSSYLESDSKKIPTGPIVKTPHPTPKKQDVQTSPIVVGGPSSSSNVTDRVSKAEDNTPISAPTPRIEEHWYEWLNPIRWFSWFR